MYMYMQYTYVNVCNVHVRCMYMYTSMKNISKNVEGCRDGSAKNHRTRCRDGSVQARQVIKRLHKQPHPYIIFLLEIVL